MIGQSAQIRDRPTGFAPEFTNDGQSTRWHHSVDDRWGVTLGFENSADPAEQARLHDHLRETAWQVCELIRIGQTHELIALVVKENEQAKSDDLCLKSSSA